MGTIETIYDLPRELTTFKVVGKMVIADFYDCLVSYHEGEVTRLALWDLTEAEIASISSDEISQFAQFSRNFTEVRKGGKTAIVFNDAFDYGLGRMFATHLELADVPFEIRTCHGLDDAREWLGIE